MIGILTHKVSLRVLREEGENTPNNLMPSLLIIKV
jgi:hypothetical protein